jgi:hypothetical protein
MSAAGLFDHENGGCPGLDERQHSVVAHRAVVAVAFWIILSFFLFWPLPATAWNNTIVAIAMVCFATMNPDQFSSRRRRLRSSRF